MRDRDQRTNRDANVATLANVQDRMRNAQRRGVFPVNAEMTEALPHAVRLALPMAGQIEAQLAESEPAGTTAYPFLSIPEGRT